MTATATALFRLPEDSENSGDLELLCTDGEAVRVHKAMLCWCSPVLQGCLAGFDCSQLKVEGTSHAWQALLPYLYPSYRPPPLSWESVAKIAELAHRYDIKHMLTACEDFLCAPGSTLSNDSSKPNYVVKWLELSERLHMEQFKQRCVSFVQQDMRNQQQFRYWRCRHCQYTNYEHAHSGSCGSCSRPRADEQGSSQRALLKMLSVDTLVDILEPFIS